MNQKTLLAISALAILLVAAGSFLLLNRSEKSPKPEAAQTEVTDEVSPSLNDENEEQTEDADDEDAEEITITLSATGFSPKTVTIKTGNKVIWLNESGKNATVDSNPHPVHTSYPEMNLGGFSDGGTLEFTFPEAGTFNYHNHLNASQGGTVVVE